MTALHALQPRARGTALALADRLADLAVGALVDEAMLTPKPGLVDMRGSGAHHDLNWLLMCHSAHALRPGFHAMARAGQEMADERALRERIGALGRDTEQAMMIATGGVNTHRGAIWALGLLVTAAAQLGVRRHPLAPEAQTGAMAELVAQRAGALACLADRGTPERTGHKGERARLAHGVDGARGQAQAGFPQVTRTALPALRLSRARGDAEDTARLNALLAVIAQLDDTCLLARGGRPALAAAHRGARCVLDAGGAGTAAGRTALLALEADMRRRHVSPGGAADLLAAALLLDRIEQEQVLNMEREHGEIAV
jgi:triphosphoribosyl-dephospho-CoA synthase